MDGVKVPARKDEVWNTPLYHQYWGLKDQIPGIILFFQLGDFFELFGQDAVDAAPLLEVQLTSRDRKSETPVPMCGIPIHAWTSYAEKLLSRGYKIALGEQLTDPAQSKIVERGLTRILTPGLPIDFKHLPTKKRHYLLSLSENSQTNKVDFLLLDFLERDVFRGSLENLEELQSFLLRFEPAEILVSQNLDLSTAYWGALETRKDLTQFGIANAEVNLKDYLKFTQRWSDEQLKKYWPEEELSSAPAHLQLSSNAEDFAFVSPQVFDQWNIFPELFELLDQCGSSLGSRRLREMLFSPLKNSKRIQIRQKLFASLEHYDEILSVSKKVHDMERLLGRFRVGVAQPKELLRFVQSMRPVQQLLESESRRGIWQNFFESESLQSLSDTAAHLDALVLRLESALNVDVDTARLDGFKDLIRESYDKEFDRLKNIFADTQKWLECYENELKTQTSIPSLKIRYNRIFGFYIEVTKTHSAKVPATFERRQTMVNAERFTTSVLLAKERDLLEAESNIESRAKKILDQLMESIREQDNFIKLALVEFSWIDMWAGVRKSIEALGRFGSWCEPKIISGPSQFEINEGRHPLVEIRQSSFVSNSLSLSAQDKRIMLLTGPNMAGKSTLMRQSGIAIYMAQCGFWVAAESMKWTPFEGFFSRMGATDRILQGESTFMVEMKEMSSMLSKMYDKSFLLIDEIGRGTSTQDGLSIAQALLEYLHEETKAIGIFATHYHELSEVASQLKQCANASMSIREWEGELIFLRTLEWKAASSSYGIHVAEMAGIPSSIVERARNLWKKGDSSKQDSVITEKIFIETLKAPVKEKKLQKDKNSLENLPLFND